MRRLLTLTTLLTACTSSFHTGEGTPTCGVDSTETLTDLSVKPDGFADYAEDAVARAGGSFEGTVTFPDASNELLFLSLTLAGDPEVQRRSVREPEGEGIDIAILCDDVMVVPYDLTLATDPIEDPWLDEATAVEVWITPDGEASLQLQLPFDSLVGRASPTTFNPADMASVDLAVSADRGTTGWSGSIDFLGETPPSGDGPDSSVSLLVEPWATFIATGP